MSEASPRPLTDKSAIRILVVEDRQDHADLVQAWLEHERYQLLLAQTENQALETLRTDPPDLVVLDLMLDDDAGKPTGYEICRSLRQDPKTTSIPVLMFTVLDQLEQIERGVEVEADDYLVKLSSPEEVRFRVEKLLEVRHIKNKALRTVAYLRLLEEGRRDASGPLQSPDAS